MNHNDKTKAVMSGGYGRAQIIARGMRPIWLVGLFFFAVVFPFLVGRLVLSELKSEYLEARRADLVNRLDNELKLFANDIKLKNYLAANLEKAELACGLPGASKRNCLISQNSLADDVHVQMLSAIASATGARPMLFISSRNNRIEVFHNEKEFSYYPRPGKRAAATLMQEMLNRECLQREEIKSFKPLSAMQQRLLPSFVGAVSGSYFSPLEQKKTVEEGFLDKGQGEKIFSVKRFFFSLNREPVFSYFAVFSESSIPVSRVLEQARDNCRDQQLQRSFTLKKVRALPANRAESLADLQLFRPLNFEIFRAGSHQNRELLRILYKRGELQKSPYLLGFLSARVKSNALREIDFVTWFSLSGLIVIFFSMIFMHSLLQQQLPIEDIRKKLLAAFLIATFIPAGIFFYAWSGFIEHKISFDNRKNLEALENQLKMLELSFKSEDEFLRSDFNKTLERIEEVNRGSKEELEKLIIDEMLPHLCSIVFLRNDGLMIESYQKKKSLTILDSSSARLSREILIASIYNFFKLAGFLKPGFVEKIFNSPSGKKIQAIGSLLMPMDAENLSESEAVPFTISKDEGNFRFITYKITSAEMTGIPTISYLIIMEDLGTLIGELLIRLAQSNDLYHSISEIGSRNTVFIQTHDIEATRPDFSRVWPQKATLDENERQAVNAIAQGETDYSCFLDDVAGLTTLTVARRISGFPLVAVSTLKTDRSFSLVALYSALPLTIYFLIIISLFSTILARLFLSPIDSLLQAVEGLESGQERFIQNQFNNEIAEMTDEFNNLLRGMRERRTLGRFLSSEAIDTIEQESRELVTVKGKTAWRSVLFCHIKDFNRLVENLPPEKLIILLNCFFSEMEKCIVASGGQIDKYIGDAIMAVFAPADVNTSADLACGAAGRMISQLPSLNDRLAKLGLDAVQVGIGISTGNVITGRIGANESRQDYTVIGDKVNLAARLESLCHNLPDAAVLIDENTKQGSQFKTDFYREVKVKGKNEAEKVFMLRAI
jgi:class 3 adenylate cyclase